MTYNPRPPHEQPSYLQDRMHTSPNPKRFCRSRTDAVWAGVCGGIAERFGWSSTLLRVLVVLSTFMFLGPLAFVIYIAIWLITPRAPLHVASISAEEDAFWRGVSDRPRATFGQLKYTFMDLDERLKNMERSVTSEDWRLRKQFHDLENGH